MFTLPSPAGSSGGIKGVQRGRSLVNPTLTVTISRVDMNKSFLVLNTNADSGTGAKTVTGYISSPTTVDFLTGGAASYANWEVVEFS